MSGVSRRACDRALRRGRCLKWTLKARRKQSTEDGEEDSSRQKSKQGHSPGLELSLAGSRNAVRLELSDRGESRRSRGPTGGQMKIGKGSRGKDSGSCFSKYNGRQLEDFKDGVNLSALSLRRSSWQAAEWIGLSGSKTEEEKAIRSLS